jgi:DNA gyrase/topoisomerase IV subunit A
LPCADNIQPPKGPESLRGMMLIVFNDRATPPTTKPQDRDIQPFSDTRLTTQALELEHAHEELKNLREEMQSSQEELKSANEELAKG